SFFSHTATTSASFPLSLHDALPISRARLRAGRRSSCDLQDDLARIARADGGEGFVDFGEWKLVRDHGPGVDQSRGEIAAHQFPLDRKSTRLNSSHVSISYAVFCLQK